MDVRPTGRHAQQPMDGVMMGLGIGVGLGVGLRRAACAAAQTPLCCAAPQLYDMPTRIPVSITTADS